MSTFVDSLKNDPAPEHIWDVVERRFGCTLPAQYKRFMSTHNGGEGFVGAQYLILWKAEEVISANRDYEVARYAPGLLLFASTGGGEAFAFDTRTSDLRICVVPLIGMCLNDAKAVADSFDGFLARLVESREGPP